MNNNIQRFIENKHKKEEHINNFINWFGQSTAIENNGRPIVLYHGTTHNFSTFKTEYHWKESFAGEGFYFTNAIEDASVNYASKTGPDLIGKIDNRRDELTDQESSFYSELLDIDESIIDEMNEDELDILIDEQIKKELAGDNEGYIIPAYLKMENPLVLDFKNGTEFDWNIELNGNATDLEHILNKAHNENSNLENIDYFDPYIIYEEIKDEILMANISDVNDLLNYLNEDNYDFQNFKNENEQEFNLLFSSLKNMLIKHYGNEDECLEIEEEFSGQLYDLLEHLKNHIDDFCSIPSNESSENLILKIHENIGLEVFSDYSINIQKLKTSIESIEEFSYIDYKETGEMFQFNKVLNDFARKNHYDGIVMTPKETHFHNMKEIDLFTRHYIVFNPNQIKSAIGNNGEYSLDHDDICYRIQNSSKIKKYTSLKVIEDLTNIFSKKFNINIEMIKDNNNVKGYLKSGTIYINKNNIENEQDLIKTLNHETFHIGFKKKFGNTGKVYLDKAFKLFNENKDLEDIRIKYNLNFDKPAERLKAAEEKLAEIAENKGDLPFLNNLKGMFRKNIKELELKIEKNINFDYKDIDIIINSSFIHVLKTNKKENVKTNKTKIKL
jgi:hypothetical protein